MGVCGGGLFDFVERDLVERQIQLAREHLVDGIEFLHPAGFRLHGADAGGVDILGELDAQAGDGLAGERGRDLVHQPAIALLESAEHFDVARLRAEHLLQLRGELAALLGAFADARHQFHVLAGRDLRGGLLHGVEQALAFPRDHDVFGERGRGLLERRGTCSARSVAALGAGVQRCRSRRWRCGIAA